VRGQLRTTSPRIDRALAAVLLGDAAAGFLPTAGIGAGMAMKSAWVLARMLSHAPEVDLTALLAEYERTQKPRVEAAQGSSRALA